MNATLVALHSAIALGRGQGASEAGADARAGGRLTFRSALLAVGLHSNMRIEMVQSAVCLFAAIPAALVHALNLLVAASGTLVLLGTGNRDERVDL